MSFASKLQEIRLEHGISQEELAEMLNVTRQSVSKWERGRGYPEIEKLIHISERFGVSLDELLKEKKDSSGNPRREISLSKEESMPESDSIRTAYPVNSSDEGIYPQGTGYTPESAGTDFRHEVVSERDFPAKYTDYTCSESIPASNRSGSFFDRIRKRAANMRRRKRRFFTRKLRPAEAVIFTVIISAFIIFAFVMIMTQMPSASRVDVYESVDYASELSDPVTYNTELYIDKSTGIFYIMIRPSKVLVF